MISKPHAKVTVLTRDHVGTFDRAFSIIGWKGPPERIRQYLLQQERGERVVLGAWHGEDFAGYLTILWQAAYESFRMQRIPEIHDLNVIPSKRRQGVASHLMDEAERRVAERGPLVGLGVGLFADYGPAQRMYATRGYVPDGLGITYENRRLQFGEPTTVNDALVLYLTKDLRKKQ